MTSLGGHAGGEVRADSHPYLALLVDDVRLFQ